MIFDDMGIPLGNKRQDKYSNFDKYMRSVQKVSSHVLSKIETFIEEDTRNIVHRTMVHTPLESRYLGPHRVLPITISCCTVFS